MLSLGHETLAPYAKAGADGEPMFRLPAPPGERVPFLSYASGAYLGRLVDQIIRQVPAAPPLDPIYETDMAEGLKAMALEGHGLAFLPSSSVRKELKSRRLVSASDSSSYELTMEVRAYREKPEMARHTKAAAQALWDFLKSQ
jgi:DNA-binding transcriptional LysR family regulator